MKEIISRIKLIEAKIGLYFYLQLTWEKKLDMIQTNIGIMIRNIHRYTSTQKKAPKKNTKVYLNQFYHRNQNQQLTKTNPN